MIFENTFSILCCYSIYTRLHSAEIGIKNCKNSMGLILAAEELNFDSTANKIPH